LRIYHSLGFRDLWKETREEVVRRRRRRRRRKGGPVLRRLCVDLKRGLMGPCT
jgi:hypothetical protein